MSNLQQPLQATFQSGQHCPLTLDNMDLSLMHGSVFNASTLFSFRNSPLLSETQTMAKEIRPASGTVSQEITVSLSISITQL